MVADELGERLGSTTRRSGNSKRRMAFEYLEGERCRIRIEGFGVRGPAG